MYYAGLTDVSPRWNYLSTGARQKQENLRHRRRATIRDSHNSRFLCRVCHAAVDVSPNRRSYRAKLLSAASTYSRTPDGIPVEGCCRKLARIMGRIKGACGQSLSASCTMRKITRPKYVGTCVRLCKYALRRALTKRWAFLSCFWRRKLFAYYICEPSETTARIRTWRLIFQGGIDTSCLCD